MYIPAIGFTLPQGTVMHQKYKGMTYDSRLKDMHTINADYKGSHHLYRCVFKDTQCGHNLVLRLENSAGNLSSRNQVTD